MNSDHHFRPFCFVQKGVARTDGHVTTTQSTSIVVRTVDHVSTNRSRIQKAVDTKMLNATRNEPKLMSISKGTSAVESARTKGQWRRALG